jgi:hypothetical protein
MSYQLYYSDGTASMGVRVMLEEIGASYELIETTTEKTKPRPAEQLKVKRGRLLMIKLGIINGYLAKSSVLRIFIFLC